MLCFNITSTCTRKHITLLPEHHQDLCGKCLQLSLSTLIRRETTTKKTDGAESVGKNIPIIKLDPCLTSCKCCEWCVLVWMCLHSGTPGRGVWSSMLLSWTRKVWVPWSLPCVMSRATTIAWLDQWPTAWGRGRGEHASSYKLTKTNTKYHCQIRQDTHILQATTLWKSVLDCEGQTLPSVDHTLQWFQDHEWTSLQRRQTTQQTITTQYVMIECIS